jgi:hypothetical protein
MADLSITSTQVLPDVTGGVFNGIAGGTITAGMPIYLDETTNTLKAADANASAATAAAKGIALHGASTGQPLRIQTNGDVTLGAGAAPAAGAVYVVSATPGGIAPAADLTTGWYTTILGVGIGSNKVRMNVFASGVAN